MVSPPAVVKSTLCQLIPRFYDVTDGAVRIDGHDVRQVTQESLRQNVGVVQQDVFLFAASIPREHPATAKPRRLGGGGGPGGEAGGDL